MEFAEFEESENWGFRLRVDTLEESMIFGDVFVGEFKTRTDKAPTNNEVRDKVEQRQKRASLGGPPSPSLRPRKRCPEHQRARMREIYSSNQRINATMANRTSFAPAIPQYLVEQQHQSTDSNDSVDSVATQIPRSFYDDSYQRQDNAFMSGNQHSHMGMQTPAATNNLYSNDFSHIQGSSSSLNPGSAPFAPSSYSRDGFMNGFTSNSHSGQRVDSGYASSYYQQSPINPVAFNSYGNGPPNPNMALAPPGYGGHPNQFQNNFQDPYNMYNGASIQGEHQAYADLQQYGRSSPAMSYASGVSGPPSSYGGPRHAYQNVLYSSQYNGQPLNQGSNVMPQAYGNGYSNSYAVQHSTNGYSQSADENRGRGASSYGYSSTSTSNNRPSSDARNYQNPDHHFQNKKFTLQQVLGGDVHPQSHSTIRDTSLEKSIDTSTRESSEEHHPHIAEVQSVDDQKIPSINQQQGQVDRGTAQTPVLRSTRGKSITSTTPSNKATMPWVGSIPRMGSEGSGITNRSPPKMVNLLASGGIGGRSLGPIVENDPFAVQPHPSRLQSFNPFVTPHQVPGPYNSHALTQAPKISQALYALTKNGRPTFEEATNNLPFVEYCRLAETNDFGVIKIKNIPYSVERSEVFAFLGRNARVINETDYEPVHIVMERVTSKTLDCYVEFVNFNEAVNAVNRFETNRTGGRGGRLGPRHVEVELSSQEQLMKELFPKAKNVLWKGIHPTIIAKDPHDPYNSGFQGFVSKEELVMLVKHVEAPQRSPFSKECPERPFECIISTLLKYPWQMVDYITIEDRELLHKATLTLLQLLKERVDGNNYEDRKINPVLYKRVWRAALKCPGFSPAQKDDFIFLVGLPQEMAFEYGLPEYAACWKTLWTIGPKAGYPNDLINYYAALIREYTDQKKELSLAERAAQGEQRISGDQIFGNLGQHTAYPPPSQFMHLTLAQVAAIEWQGIEEVLRASLRRQLE